MLHDLFTLKDLSKCYFKKHKEGIYHTKYCKEIVLTLTEGKESTRIYQASGYIVHAHILKRCVLFAPSIHFSSLLITVYAKNHIVRAMSKCSEQSR